MTPGDLCARIEFHAIGKRIRSLPITIEKLMEFRPRWH